MSEDWYKKAIIAIDNVMQHPAAILFNSPYEAEPDTESDYYQVIKNPQDFGSIKKRLENKQYKKIDEVVTDVELIYKNTKQFYGEGEITLLANHCFKQFMKQLRKNDILPFSKWCNEVFRLRTRFAELMSNLPNKVRQFSSSINQGRTTKQTTPIISESELQRFIAAAEKLQSEEDQKEMIRILNENQPELDVGSSEILLEITRLNHQTFNALKKYMTEALERKGLRYPD
ncbi:Bromodomain containing protein [Trichomonas vaginalis G3]|uniref:Bromodomain containing protein n=1 Tax=Trichomonas vaginalis (strain ATCC PRA-98 / G3) TaxID=412133 RepID=A2F8F5_TRIV3|nr:acetylation-dependent protein binding [Trichomonas vaginalis G3]EAX98806.1 Bromodomain containing protein [Trichomonas vaginalis G3]KAI5526379.1 acetylation-dependent protein binding [Trichomonas vaginalis G3]|eukprot:XP_001311736.1 Bromodomain containing protein [Trichomonas vaginalis G3]